MSGVTTGMGARASSNTFSCLGGAGGEILCNSMDENSARTCVDIFMCPASAFRNNSFDTSCFLRSLGSYAYTRIFVSRKSGPVMQIIPGPIALANLELELFEAVFQGF